MKKSEKAKGTAGFSETVTEGPETKAADKPRRGRKPRADVKQEAKDTTEPESVVESITEPEPVNEGITEPEPVTEDTTEEKTESVQENVTESEPVNEDITESKTEPVAESITEPEPVTEDTAESEPTPVTETETVKADAVQVVESPLMLMKREFQKRSQVIKEQMRDIQNAFLTIGFQLHWIRENNMFRVLDYKNVYDYAEKEYGIKKTTCCNLISIIENYAERNEKGEVIESIADCYRNYSASQLVAMLGMPEEMKQQVTPDMSVRAIKRLRQGEPDPVTAEDSPAPAKESVPVKEPDAETPAPDNAAFADEKTEMPKTDSNAEEVSEMDAVDTATEEISETVAGTVTTEEISETAADTVTEEISEMVAAGIAEEERTEDTGTPEQERDAAAEKPEEDVPNPENMLAEIDSYTDYRSMAEEIDLMIRHVFSVGNAVRVRILCVQG